MHNKIIYILMLVVSSAISSKGQNQSFSKRIYGIHGDFPSTLKAKNTAGENIAVGSFGLGANLTVGNEYIGGMMEYDYRRINLKSLHQAGPEYVNIHEFYIGIRYFSLRPTFMIGNVALRLSVSAAGGLDLEPNWRGMLSAGVAVSPITSMSGGMVSIVYRPGRMPNDGITFEPSWALRTSIVIGPSLKD